MLTEKEQGDNWDREQSGMGRGASGGGGGGGGGGRWQRQTEQSLWTPLPPPTPHPSLFLSLSLYLSLSLSSLSLTHLFAHIPRTVQSVSQYNVGTLKRTRYWKHLKSGILRCQESVSLPVCSSNHRNKTRVAWNSSKIKPKAVQFYVQVHVFPLGQSASRVSATGS